MFLHNTTPQNPSIAPTNVESEGKNTEAKDRAPNKKSKGTSGITSLIGGKAGESVNAASSSGNDGATQRFDNLNLVLKDTVNIHLLL